MAKHSKNSKPLDGDRFGLQGSCSINNLIFGLLTSYRPSGDISGAVEPSVEVLELRDNRAADNNNAALTSNFKAKFMPGPTLSVVLSTF